MGSLDGHAVVVKLVGADILAVYPLDAKACGLDCIKKRRILQLDERLEIEIRLYVEYPFFVVAKSNKQKIILLRNYVYSFGSYHQITIP